MSDAPPPDDRWRTTDRSIDQIDVSSAFETCKHVPAAWALESRGTVPRYTTRLIVYKEREREVVTTTCYVLHDIVLVEAEYEGGEGRYLASVDSSPNEIHSVIFHQTY